jgi:hypothetical protein
MEGGRRRADPGGRLLNSPVSSITTPWSIGG